MPEVQPQCHHRDRACSGSPGASATARRLGEIVEQSVAEPGDERIFKPHSSNRDRLAERLVKPSPLFSVELFQVGVLEPKHMCGKPVSTVASFQVPLARTEELCIPARKTRNCFLKNSSGLVTLLVFNHHVFRIDANSVLNAKGRFDIQLKKRSLITLVIATGGIYG